MVCGLNDYKAHTVSPQGGTDWKRHLAGETEAHTYKLKYLNFNAVAMAIDVTKWSRGRWDSPIDAGDSPRLVVTRHHGLLEERLSVANFPVWHLPALHSTPHVTCRLPSPILKPHTLQRLRQSADGTSGSEKLKWSHRGVLRRSSRR